MTVTIILYLAALSQLYLISFYYPQIIMKRIRFILDNCPPETHPKLYPAKNGFDSACRGLSRYKTLTRSTLAIGLVGLVALAASQTPINDAIITLFAMLQFIPLILLEIGELRHYKKMREVNTETKRSADLKRRRYFDYISPAKFSLAVIMLAIYITFNLYRVDFDLSFGSNGLITLVTIIGVHIFFAANVIWLMYGKKLNPHMEHKDRDNHLQGVVNTTYYVSIAVSSFLLIYGLLQHYSLDQYEPIALSIYMQLCAFLGLGTMLRTNKLENINFDVYKDDATAR